MLVGIVPAAGYGRRLGGRPGSKEMIAVGGRPVIDYLIEQMSWVEPDEIRVVTRPDKSDVAEYARSRGLTAVFGLPANVSESLMMGASGLSASDTVIFGFPDTLWTPVNGFELLLAGLEKDSELSLGLFRIDDALQRSDVVTLDPTGRRVLRIAVKPEFPESNLIWGCAAIRVSGLQSLAGDPEPGVCFSRIAATSKVSATVLSDRWLDIGTPGSLALATVLYG